MENTPLLCACGCGRELRRAKYPSQQGQYVRGHNPSVKLTDANIQERFWARVNRTDGCWLWTGEASAHFGYGRLNVKGRRTRAHRFSWELANGPIPVGKFLLHSCDNPLCVRPDHLRLGDQAENMRDMHARGRDRHSRKRSAA